MKQIALFAYLLAVPFGQAEAQWAPQIPSLPEIPKLQSPDLEALAKNAIVPPGNKLDPPPDPKIDPPNPIRIPPHPESCIKIENTNKCACYKDGKLVERICQ